MFKLRLNPTVRQLRLWNTEDLTDDYYRPKPIHSAFPRGDDVPGILSRREPWFEAASGRLEIVNRIKLWRFLTGDESFDVHYWLGRLENTPGLGIIGDLRANQRVTPTELACVGLQKLALSREIRAASLHTERNPQRRTLVSP